VSFRAGSACQNINENASLNFNKRRQLFIRTDNETLPIVAMCIKNVVSYIAPHTGIELVHQP
jgi:hypothetical protein